MKDLLIKIFEIIIPIIVCLCTGVIALRYKSFKEWLVYAVCEAEEYFKSGTGQLKLRYVYDLAITKYSFIARIITFEKFSKLVDSALIKMKEMIESNKNIEKILADNGKKETN